MPFKHDESKLSFYDTAKRDDLIFPELAKYFDKMAIDNSLCSLRGYQDSFSRFLIYFNIHSIFDLDNITLGQLIDFQDSLRKTLNYKSVNTHILRIKAIWNFLLYKEREKIKSKVITELRGLKKSVNENDELDDDEVEDDIFILEDYEIENMIENCKDIQEKLTLVFLNEFALRRDEATKILLTDIRLDANGKTYLYVKGKGNKKVKFAMKDSVLKLLDEAIKNRESDCKFLFYGQKTKEGLTGNAIFNRVIRAAKNAGVSEDRIEKIGAHTLRRTAISRWATMFDILLVRDMARHNDIRTTQRYVKVKRQNIDNAFLFDNDK